MRPVTQSAPVAPEIGQHLPVPEGEGCLEILSDRLRMSPGIVAIEADFRAGSLTVRYQPAHVSPEQLNEVADDVGALFSQRVTHCERREALGSCEECALRLGRVPEAQTSEFRPISDGARVGITRHQVPADSAELVRPLDRKVWVERMSPAEQEHFAKGRAMAALTGACLVLLVAGVVPGRSGVGPAWPGAAFALSALCGSWFALRSTAASLARGRFDVNLLMILAAVGAGWIGYVFEGAVLM